MRSTKSLSLRLGPAREDGSHMEEKARVEGVESVGRMIGQI